MKHEYIHKVKKASGATAGETVLVHFWGEDADKLIANEFVAAVASMGANNMFSGQNEAEMHMDFVNSGSFELLPMK